MTQWSQVGAAALRAVLDNIPARVALIDRQRRHLFVNQEYARFLGHTPAEILGRTVAEAIGAQAFQAIEAYGASALRGETVRWEGWLSYAAGPRYVQRVYAPYRADAGGIEGYFVFARDITPQKQAEANLAQQVAELDASQALNAAIIASALDCVVVIDEAGCVVEFNPAAERTFGYRRADTLGQPIGDLIVPPHLQARHTRGFARYLATGEAHVLGRRMEMEAMHADGRTFPVELAITEVKLPERRLFTAYLRDLTAVKEAAQALQHSRDALHQSEKMAAFGSLLAGVAHELNNPLSIVIGNAMMLHEQAVDENAQGFAGRAAKIQAAAERCAKIVRTFLAMARQQNVRLRPVEVAPLVQATLDLLAYGLRSHGIEVSVDLPPGRCRVLGDPDQLGQVLLNLVVNAQQTLEAQAAPRRIGITVQDRGAEVAIHVADNGPGVPPAISRRIFDPFFTTKPTGAGTGIGLAVSRGIAETHAGSLTLSTPDGGGACFTLRVPKPDGAAPNPATPAVPTPSGVGRAALIVDDEAEVAAVLAQMLQRQGFRCHTAGSGREAQVLLAANPYDAILCDLHMPDVDGPALFTWMQANRPDLCRRIAFVTGDTLGHAAVSFLAQAGRPVLEKPFVPDEVRRLLSRLAAAS